MKVSTSFSNKGETSIIPLTRFYTLPPCIEYPWIIVNIFNYKKLQYFRFKHAILDSGVNRIFFNWHQDNYPKSILARIETLATQLSQIYRNRLWVTIPDYPDDYYPGFIKDNIERTVQNIKRFMAISGVDWLPVIQSRYLDIFSFYESCQRVKDLIGDYPRVAIGTVCKTNKLRFIVECCRAARTHFPKSHIHAFGLTLRALPKVKNLIDSWDSLAWTFPRKSGMASCKNREERIAYFNQYITRIEMVQKNEEIFDESASAERQPNQIADEKFCLTTILRVSS